MILRSERTGKPRIHAFNYVTVDQTWADTVALGMCTERYEYIYEHLTLPAPVVIGLSGLDWILQ
jgi:hypothetical protein